MSMRLTAMSLEAVIRGVACSLGRDLAVKSRLRMPPRTLLFEQTDRARRLA